MIIQVAGYMSESGAQIYRHFSPDKISKTKKLLLNFSPVFFFGAFSAQKKKRIETNKRFFFIC